MCADCTHVSIDLHNDDLLFVFCMGHPRSVHTHTDTVVEINVQFCDYNWLYWQSELATPEDYTHTHTHTHTHTNPDNAHAHTHPHFHTWTLFFRKLLHPDTFLHTRHTHNDLLTHPPSQTKLSLHTHTPELIVSERRHLAKERNYWQETLKGPLMKPSVKKINGRGGMCTQHTLRHTHTPLALGFDTHTHTLTKHYWDTHSKPFEKWRRLFVCH